MATMTVSKVAVAIICIVALLSLSAPNAVEGLTCGQVSSSLSQCIGYLKGAGGMVPPACCNGVRNLNNMARTPIDRKQACGCLKTLAGSIKGLNQGLAAGVPAKCGVNIPFKISLSTDCSRVQ